jgi:membrane associated rhomboid family serine protease
MNGTGTYTKSWVIRLIIINVVVFLIQEIFSVRQAGGQAVPLGNVMTQYFGLLPILVIQKFYIWQLFTYMFLHGGFFHIFLNMYALLIFGIPVEQAWGSKRFLFYYFFTGIGAGITILIINTMLGGINYVIPTIGASGAIFGLLLAFGMLFPDAQILIFFLIPMRAKFLVFLYGGLELYALVTSGGQSPISHAGHLGGLLFGIIYFFVIRNRHLSFKSKVIKARLSREIKRREAVPAYQPGDNESKLRGILDKVLAGGTGSLTDDDYQFIRYMEIMLQDAGEKCVEEDFNIEDDFCKNCKNVEACLLRKIKSHL